MNLNLLNETEESQLQNIVAEAERVLILGHVNADGDAIGSCLTWAEFLRRKGKIANVVVPDMFPDFLRWMPGIERVMRYDKVPQTVDKLMAESDTIFCLDFNTPSRITDELGKKLVKAPGRKVLIDHHLNPDVETALTISHPDMSSTAEIVFRLIHQLGGYDDMTKSMAMTAYCGMMTDTGGFTFNSTRPEIFLIISLLLAKGIDKDKIYRNVFNTFSQSRLRLTGYVLYEKLRVLSPLRASYYIITKEEQKRFNYIKGDAEGLVNMPLQIKGHRLSISLREDSEKPDTVWLSLRSVDDFPCNEMAAKFFNGGGHKNASGGRLYCSIEEAEKIVVNAIRAYSALL